MHNRNTTLTVAIVAITIIFVAVIFFGLNTVGKIEFRFEDASLLIHTAAWKDCTVAYEDIDRIELRNDVDTGARVNGYGSGKLSLGSFQNSEFGRYQLYCYTKCSKLAVMYLTDGTVLAVGGEDSSASEELYDMILARLQ